MAKSISRYLADISSTSGVLDGTLSTAAQSNITSLGTLSSLTVSGSAAMTLTTAAQPNITSLGTLTNLVVDDITINGSTISDAADFVIDAGGDITLDADGGDVFIDDGGTRLLSISNAGSNNVQISTSISDGDLLFKGNDGGSTITALTLDMSEAGKATFNAGIVAGGLTYPTSDGSNGQVLTTNGSGALSFAAGGKSTEEIQDIVGAMFTSNTETRGSLTYQDGDGTIDLVVDDMTANTVTTINSNTNNYVITGTGTANTLQGESGLTFDGTTLTSSGNQIITTTNNEWLAYNGSGTSPYLRMKSSGTNNGYIQFTTTSSYFWNDRINRGIRLSNTAYPEFYNGSAYCTMWHSGNAPISTSGANNVLKADGSGYLLLDNWIRCGNNTGLYTSQGAYVFPDTTYGWFIRSGASSTSSSARGQGSGGGATYWLYGETDYDQGFLTNTGGWSWKGDNSGNWTATANITAYSDIRLKEEVVTIPNALEKVTKLRGVEYTRKSTKVREIGVIAQEVKEVVPELVSIIDERTEANGEGLEDLHVMKYQNTVGLLIEAIKELKAEVDELKGSK